MQSITAYLFFDGNCREAMEFYARCLEAELEIRTYAEGSSAASDAHKVMHAVLTKPDGVLMASDAPAGMPFQTGSNFSLALNCGSVEEIESRFRELGADGKVVMALHDAPWGARFGILHDQFGIQWMFNYDYNKKA